MKIGKIWLLIGMIIFSGAGVLYSLKGDKIGAMIDFGIAFFFLIGFIVQVVMGKRQKSV